jgi:hypothetical protein
VKRRRREKSKRLELRQQEIEESGEGNRQKLGQGKKGASW